jgi:copper chaperone CopZ
MKLKLVPALALAAACLSTHAADATANATNTFAVTGMHCDGCAKGITSELKRTPGVITTTVSFSNQLAVVALDTNRVNSAQLIKVIEEAGYKAKLKQP